MEGNRTPATSDSQAAIKTFTPSTTKSHTTIRPIAPMDRIDVQIAYLEQNKHKIKDQALLAEAEDGIQQLRDHKEVYLQIITGVVPDPSRYREISMGWNLADVVHVLMERNNKTQEELRAKKEEFRMRVEEIRVKEEMLRAQDEKICSLKAMIRAQRRAARDAEQDHCDEGVGDECESWRFGTD